MVHRRISLTVFTGALLSGLTVSTSVDAQSTPPAAPPAKPAAEVSVAATSRTPRIGLALSGGGARGLAHVGVLKVLEEMRIPVACVTGTSMGAIVGGTFAAGRTPEEMEKIVVAASWNDIFRDAPPRKEIAVRRKFDDYKTLFKPEFGVKDGGLLLPKGVIAGVSIESFFRELATPAFGIGDFNKLPIPFRAMATDIETGDSVVLDHGSLSQAMRASMSVPGAIAPVEIDGRLLVDGGIANNLPIDEARRLCGEVIIAVNISTPPLKRDEITSALSVTAQLINFLGKQTVDQQIKSLGPNDVLIAPDLGDISAGSFEHSKDAIKAGEEATRAMADKLRRYSLPPEQYAALRTKQVAESKALGSVDEIRVEGVKRTNPAVAEALVESKAGEPLTEDKLGADLRRIYGTGDYESISYRIVGGETGPRALLIQPIEKSWGPDYLRFGLALASDFSGDSQFNALVQYRKSWINRLGAEWTTDAQIGQNNYLGDGVLSTPERGGKVVRRAECLRWSADARRVRWRRQGGGLPRQHHAGRPRRRRRTGDLGSVARRLCNLTRLCTRRHRFAGTAINRGHHGRTARGDFHRSDRPCVVPSGGIRAGGNRLLGNGIAGFGGQLQPHRSRRSRDQELGTAHAQRGGQRRLVARLGHAGLRASSRRGALHLSAYRLNEFYRPASSRSAV